MIAFIAPDHADIHINIIYFQDIGGEIIGGDAGGQGQWGDKQGTAAQKTADLAGTGQALEK
ncbi:MAG: hypothetical protein II007_04270 [Gammaproteobacteria bacterium]|nr:hypothetical protein [Gammaproteobacteria bacterium]